MFDWFREMAEELSGIDSSMAKKERMRIREKKKSNHLIFSSKMKIFIIIMGVIYIMMSGSTMAILWGNAGTMLYILKYFFMIIIAIVIILALLVGRNKGEYVALVGIFIFVVGLFLSTIFVIV